MGTEACFDLGSCVRITGRTFLAMGECSEPSFDEYHNAVPRRTPSQVAESEAWPLGIHEDDLEHRVLQMMAATLIWSGCLSCCLR